MYTYKTLPTLTLVYCINKQDNNNKMNHAKQYTYSLRAHSKLLNCVLKYVYWIIQCTRNALLAFTQSSTITVR